jgi:hypothetical protein
VDVRYLRKVLMGDDISPAVSIVAATDRWGMFLGGYPATRRVERVAWHPETGYVQVGGLSSVPTADDIASVSLHIHCKRQKQTVSCVSFRRGPGLIRVLVGSGFLSSHSFLNALSP